MSITEIIEKLKELDGSLAQATLSIEGVDEMTNLSRELYERLVVVRFKAFEKIAEMATQPDVEEPAAEDAPLPEDTDTVEKYEETEADEPTEIYETESSVAQSFHIGTEVSPNQISLIDSIEEISQLENTVKDALGDSTTASLAQRLTMKPISDLRTALGINQKFKFISSLFEKDEKAFQQSIERINESNGFIEADEYVQNVLKPRYGWEPKNAVVMEFMALVERRFL